MGRFAFTVPNIVSIVFLLLTTVTFCCTVGILTGSVGVPAGLVPPTDVPPPTAIVIPSLVPTETPTVTPTPLPPTWTATPQANLLPTRTPAPTITEAPAQDTTDEN